MPSPRSTGVDVLMLGPGDFSIQSGIPGQLNHEQVRQTTEKIAAAARRAGKHWGCPSGSVEQTQRLLDMGARVIFHHADIVAIKIIQEEIQRTFAPLGFTFENRLGGQHA